MFRNFFGSLLLMLSALLTFPLSAVSQEVLDNQQESANKIRFLRIGPNTALEVPVNRQLNGKNLVAVVTSSEGVFVSLIPYRNNAANHFNPATLKTKETKHNLFFGFKNNRFDTLYSGKDTPYQLKGDCSIRISPQVHITLQSNHLVIDKKSLPFGKSRQQSVGALGIVGTGQPRILWMTNNFAEYSLFKPVLNSALEPYSLDSTGNVVLAGEKLNPLKSFVGVPVVKSPNACRREGVTQFISRQDFNTIRNAKDKASAKKIVKEVLDANKFEDFLSYLIVLQESERVVAFHILENKLYSLMPVRKSLCVVEQINF